MQSYSPYTSSKMKEDFGEINCNRVKDYNIQRVSRDNVIDVIVPVSRMC